MSLCPTCLRPPPPRTGTRGPAPAAHPACIRLAAAVRAAEAAIREVRLEPEAWRELRKRLLGLANARTPAGASRGPGGRWVAAGAADAAGTD